MMSVLAGLKKTREILEKRGRTSGDLIDRGTCRVCLLGAIGLAVLGDEFEDYPDYAHFHSGGAASPVVDELLKYVSKHWGSYEDIYRFNDVTASTDDDVFALIDQAIAGVENDDIPKGLAA